MTTLSSIPSWTFVPANTVADIQRNINIFKEAERERERERATVSFPAGKVLNGLLVGVEKSQQCK